MEFYHTCWEFRNLIEFVGSPEEGIRIRKDKLLDRITLTYNRRKNIFLSKYDRWINRLFQKPLREWKDASLKMMQDWIKTYKQTIAQREVDTFNFDIRDFLKFDVANLYWLDGER